MSIIYFLIDDFQLTHPRRTDTGKISYLSQIHGQSSPQHMPDRREFSFTFSFT